jgi:hypothetical protein
MVVCGVGAVGFTSYGYGYSNGSRAGFAAAEGLLEYWRQTFIGLCQ